MKVDQQEGHEPELGKPELGKPELGKPELRKQEPPPAEGPPKSLALYATLHILTLVGCWAWFVALWLVALLSYNLGDLEWWVLVVGACMGIYGLRPNLERAIDTAWLQNLKSSEALAERIAQLRPVKRRIDILFSVSIVVVLILGLIAWGLLLAFGVISGDFTL